MAIPTIPKSQQWLWWQGVRGRIDILENKKKGNWFKKLWNKVSGSFYDMGQNIRTFIKAKLGIDIGGILEIPGHEVCSSFVSSVISCGFEVLGTVNGDYNADVLHKEMGVKQTSSVTPSHFGTVPSAFRIVPTGQTIKSGSVKLNLSWDSIDFGIEELLKKLAKINPKKDYNQFSEIFKDGIRLTQRDLLKHPDPFWRAGHAEFIDKVEGDVVKAYSQEAVLLHKTYSMAYLWDGMAGEQPRFIILEPTFLS